jgi:riboflavin kinase/FMN adenylyltransferase
VHLIRDLAALPDTLRQGAVSVGNFDGVHRGHARIVERLLAQAAAASGPAIVFTFDPHPVRLLRPELAPPPLTWIERKAELLQSLGVEALIAYPTDQALLDFTPREFFESILVRQLAAKAIVEGPNFRFGRQRAGTIETLAGLCRHGDVRLEIVEPLTDAGDVVSSSRIRKLISTGHVAAAADLSTAPYRIRGLVTHGARRGATLGFPTANIEGIDTLMPAIGVYAGVGVIRGQGSGVSGRQERWPAAINIGPNPTFGEHATKVEVHLIGYFGDIYGQVLEVDFIDRIRDIRAFDSAEDLKRQLAADVVEAKEIVAEGDGPPVGNLFLTPDP